MANTTGKERVFDDFVNNALKTDGFIRIGDHEVPVVGYEDKKKREEKALLDTLLQQPTDEGSQGKQ